MTREDAVKHKQDSKLRSIWPALRIEPSVMSFAKQDHADMWDLLKTRSDVWGVRVAFVQVGPQRFLPLNKIMLLSMKNGRHYPMSEDRMGLSPAEKSSLLSLVANPCEGFGYAIRKSLRETPSLSDDDLQIYDAIWTRDAFIVANRTAYQFQSRQAWNNLIEHEQSMLPTEHAAATRDPAIAHLGASLVTVILEQEPASWHERYALERSLLERVSQYVAYAGLMARTKLQLHEGWSPFFGASSFPPAKDR